MSDSYDFLFSRPLTRTCSPSRITPSAEALGYFHFVRWRGRRIIRASQTKRGTVVKSKLHPQHLKMIVALMLIAMTFGVPNSIGSSPAIAISHLPQSQPRKRAPELNGGR